MLQFVDPKTRRQHSAGLVGKAKEQASASMLWRAVIAQAIVDVYGSDFHRNQVIRWLASPDFDEVCDHANVDTAQMREQIASLCRLPLPLAKKYGKMLRDMIMSGIHTPDPT
jgi:hypothetical protein